jgi:hypothetical protein
MAVDGSISSIASSGPADKVPKGPKLIVKIGLAGDVYVNLRAVSVPEMLEAVSQVKHKNGFVVYYREAAMQDSAPEAMEVFKQLVALRPAIQMGNMARSELGTLTWVEIEEAPVVSRFFLARGELLMLLPGLDEIVVSKKVHDRVAEAIFSRVDLFVRCDRVLETRMHESELCLDPRAQAVPSLHVRLAYGDKGWASQYLIKDVPSNLRSFQQDVYAYGLQIVEAMKKQK